MRDLYLTENKNINYKEIKVEESLSNYKSQASKAARDLGYGHETIKSIRTAKSLGEIERIMRTARKEKFG